MLLNVTWLGTHTTWLVLCVVFATRLVIQLWHLSSDVLGGLLLPSPVHFSFNFLRFPSHSLPVLSDVRFALMQLPNINTVTVSKASLTYGAEWTVTFYSPTGNVSQLQVLSSTYGACCVQHAWACWCALGRGLVLGCDLATCVCACLKFRTRLRAASCPAPPC